MANGSVSQSDTSPRHRRLSIQATTLKISKPDEQSCNSDGTASESEPSPKGTPEIPLKPATLSSLARQVSHDGLNNFSDNDAKQPATQGVHSSPIHCVSEFDKATTSTSLMKSTKPIQKFIPYHPNPLHNPTLFSHHIHALRLEAALHPLRLILSRLMTNVNYNRKGIFNSPVDPVALGLPDYFDVIEQPMDLGTVKNRLHSVAYQSRSEVANDIRLCFRNAMKYNPPQNTIHFAAKELQLYFEDQLRSFCPEIADLNLLNDVNSFLYENEHVSSKSLLSNDDNDHDALMSTEDSSSTPLLSIATRTTSIDDASVSAKKRKKRGSKMRDGHSCQLCHGNICSVCEQGCLPLQPTLLICNGAQCIGAKIRKGATYFIAPDGSCQYCQRCYAGLPAVLPQSGKHDDFDVCRYKRNLLKRKNDEEVVEHWLTCVDCRATMHRMCVLHNPYAHDSEHFRCPNCFGAVDSPLSDESSTRLLHSAVGDTASERYTFVAGADLPVPMSAISQRSSIGMLCSEALPETSVSRLIEEKVRQRMMQDGCPNSEKTIVVRVISECDRYYKVPEVIRKHFRVQGAFNDQGGTLPPLKVLYHSKAIALFQKIDGLDVCIFCMFVQEYNGNNDDFDSQSDKANFKQEKRVYIAYLDSVEHFRPRTCRTAVYQEVLTAYLASARLRGYETAHIWACPPSRGNSFVFWNHPAAQRTPNMERLTAWYHRALSRAMDCGVVTDVKSLYESDFEKPLHRIKEVGGSRDVGIQMWCPPLLEGDFWIEEALRIHALTLSRLSKDKSVPVDESPSTFVPDDVHDPCPAVQIATMFREKIITHPLAKAFRRPVNAAALKLNDYHSIITKPMDLGTVHSRCVLGEYRTLGEMVADVDLVFANAKKFNPPGHIVHSNAIVLSESFENELNKITETWLDPQAKSNELFSWKVFDTMDMSLSHRLTFFEGLSLVESPSVKESTDVVAALSVCLSTVSSSEKLCDPSSKDSSRSASSSSANIMETDKGPESIRQKMVGRDVWLLEKKIVIPPSSNGTLKNLKRGRKCTTDSIDEPSPKRRRQTWLGEEVGVAVRRMRTSFFRCSLLQIASDDEESVSAHSHSPFLQYVRDFKMDNERAVLSSRVADARHALLEFSQFRSLEFDTLRRAKYSSAMLLYHLHHEDAPGLSPVCTGCGEEIEFVRWHRVCKVAEIRSTYTMNASEKRTAASSTFMPEELCSSCYSKQPNQNHFIPLQVSM